MMTLVVLASLVISAATGPLAADMRDRLFEGSHALVDPGFRYYQGRTWRGVVKEIRATGVSTITVYLNNSKPEMVTQCHREGVAFCGVLWGTIIYGASSLSPPPPTGALQVHASGPPEPGREPRFYCPRHPEFREWYGRYARETLRRIRPDAVLIGENFFGAWPGSESPMTSCFCDLCLAELARRLDREKPLVLETQEARQSLLSDEAVFREWVEMRIETWIQYMKEAHHAVKEALPGAAVGALLLAVDDPGGPRRIREANGQDPIALLGEVPFDFISFQPHWADWMNPLLSPEDHATSYQRYIEAIRSRFPLLRIGLVPDIGSAENCRRDSAWVRRLQVAARGAGFSFVEPYEYSVGGAIYEDPPQVIESRRLSRTSCELVFSKRLDPESARLPEQYRLETGDYPIGIDFDGGNVVTLTFPEQIPNQTHTLEITGVMDDPSTFWFNGGSDSTKWKYPGHTVPAGHVVSW